MTLKRSILVFLIYPLLYGFLTSHAHAQLGATLPDSAASGDAVRHAMFNGAVSMRTSVDDGGTTIDEYADSTGRIFAYAWHGPTMPDLRALLGAYLDTYRAGAQAQAGNLPQLGSLHTSRVVLPDVIVESGGRMRGYVGRAWLPDALPPGVAASDLH